MSQKELAKVGDLNTRKFGIFNRVKQINSFFHFNRVGVIVDTNFHFQQLVMDTKPEKKTSNPQEDPLNENSVSGPKRCG